MRRESAALRGTAGAAIVVLALASATGAGAHGYEESVGRAPQSCDKYAPPPLSAKALERVRREGVRMRVRARPPAGDDQVVLDVEGIAHVQAPVALVMDVLSDYRAYTKFMPRVVRSEWIDAGELGPYEGGAWLVEVKTPFPLPDVTTITLPDSLRCGVERWLIRWRQVGGMLPENRGVTVVYAAPGGGSIIRQKAVVATTLDLAPDYLSRGVRRYMHYVLMAVRDQSARALQNDWYEAWERFSRPVLRTPTFWREGSDRSAPR